MNIKKKKQSSSTSFPFNDLALKCANERIADLGPNDIRGSAYRKSLRRKSIFEIFDSLEKQKEKLAKIFCI